MAGAGLLGWWWFGWRSAWGVGRCGGGGGRGGGAGSWVGWGGVVRRALAYGRRELRLDSARLMGNAEIARAAGCSVPWLQTLCRRHLGVHPVQMARRARLDRAVELLTTTGESVAVVAAMTGFVS